MEGEDPYLYKVVPSITTGSIIVAQFDPTVKIISPDVYSYLEDLLGVQLLDCQLIRDGFMKAINLVMAQTALPITESHLTAIRKTTFKGRKVSVRLAESTRNFIKTIESISKTKIIQLSLPSRLSEGLLYVQNFGKLKLAEQFSIFGQIKAIDIINSTKTPIAAIQFANSTSAFNAAKIMNGKYGMIIGAIAPRDARHNFLIQNCNLDSKIIISKIEDLGNIEELKHIGNKIYVKMVNLLDSQIACALLKGEGMKTSFVCDEIIDAFITS